MAAHRHNRNWFGISQHRQTGPFKGEDFTNRTVMDLPRFLDVTGFGKKKIPNPLKKVDVVPLQPTGRPPGADNHLYSAL
ncbi:MAG: hypothetical protein HQK66_12145 [Desulfamplus sp.]|nr:hypothetical protein [Desulfamplus sp.]